jgi:hypothetical protein
MTRPALEALADARERTLAAAGARIELCTDHTWEVPAPVRRRRGGLLRPVTRVAKRAGTHVLAAATRRLDFRHQSAEGVLDLAARRYMLDYGSYARLYAEGRRWDGRSGRALATLPAAEHELPTPLWLLDVLAGLNAADDAGTEAVRGAACRRVAATADVSRASAATPGGVAVPTRARFEDLLALPVEVWLDDAHIRRVRFRFEDRTETLELWDFGLPLDDLDWSRLPTFRSPENAAGSAEGVMRRGRRARDGDG